MSFILLERSERKVLHIPPASVRLHRLLLCRPRTAFVSRLHYLTFQKSPGLKKQTHETFSNTVYSSVIKYTNYRMHFKQTLHKISCQGGHFVLRFSKIASASSAASPSSSSRTPAPIPHGGVFELHQVLEDGVTEDTAGVLRLAGRQRRASLVEVHGHQRGLAGIAALLSNLHQQGDEQT